MDYQLLILESVLKVRFSISSCGKLASALESREISMDCKIIYHEKNANVVIDATTTMYCCGDSVLRVIISVCDYHSVALY